MKARSVHAVAHRQRGVYAIEFAFVFLFFFGLLYVAICYGLMFTLRFGLQNAAEEGARAGLRYQLDPQARRTQAADVARARINSWLPADATRSVDASVCQAASNTCTPTCGATWETRCQMVVTVTAGNMNGLLPPMPSFAMPNQLTATASMLLDGKFP